MSLAFLRSIRDDPRMHEPMVRLARPDLSHDDLEAMGLEDLRSLAKELRVFSHLPGEEEFERYSRDDGAIFEAPIDDIDDPFALIASSEEEGGGGEADVAAWREVLRRPPTTTTHVNICIVKPDTRGRGGGSYAETVLAGKCDPEDGVTPLVGKPTDFVSHAWRYKFCDLVDAIEADAKEEVASDAREAGTLPFP